MARRLAASLIAHGIAIGGPVGIYADNRPEAVVLRLALIAAGAMIVSIDHDMRPEQLIHVLEDSKCRRIFTLSGDLPKVRQSCGATLEAFLLDDETNETASAESWKGLLVEETVDQQIVAPEDIAALFYTSGNTGPPKGVPLSHGNIAQEAIIVRRNSQRGRPLFYLIPLKNSAATKLGATKEYGLLCLDTPIGGDKYPFQGGGQVRPGTVLHRS